MSETFKPHGAGDDTVSPGGNVVAFGSPRVMEFLNSLPESLGSGARGVSGALGAVTVFAGSGGQNTLVAGDRPGLLVGTRNSDQVATGGARDMLLAGAGNATLSGFSAGDVHAGTTGTAQVVGAGSEQYVGGGGNDVVAAALGNETLFAGTGADAFALDHRPGAPNDLIGGVGARTEANVVAAAQVLQPASVSGGNALLHLPDGTIVTMIGVTNPTGSSSF